MSSDAAAAELLAQEIAALQKLDWVECAAAPIAFMRRHVTIEMPTGEPIRFALWPFQERTLGAIHENGQVIVLKARRLGLSWLALAYALWLAIFQQGSRVLILCKKEQDAAELLNRVRRMRDRLLLDPASAHLLAGLSTSRKGRDAVTTLDVGESVIRALVATESSARQETAAMVVLDEFAFASQADGIWRAVLPTIEGGGKLVVISTGNGVAGKGAEFAHQWSRAAAGESGFTHLFWPWDVHPERDHAWKERTIAELGDPERFKVEYPESPGDAFLRPDATLVYDLAGIDAAEQLGRVFDERRRDGELPPPEGEAIHLGIDWGIGTTHALVVWQLAGGGIYVPPGELVAVRGEPADLTRRMLDAAATYPYPLGEARYDAAGAQQMETFSVVAPPSVSLFRVDFNRRKQRTIGFLRELFRRTAEGKSHRVIAVSPENAELVRQLRGLEQDDEGKVVKGDDHGPDALIAGSWPVAAEFPDISLEADRAWVSSRP